MFEKIQDWEISLIENVFEKFSQWTQKWVGLDCFFWAKSTALIGVATTIMMLTESSFFFFSSLASSVMALCALSGVYEVERQNRRGQVSGLRNNELFGGYYKRLMSIFMLLLSSSFIPLMKEVPVIIFSVLWASQYCTYAFIACTPLPPGQSKLSKRLAILGSAIQQAFAPGNLPSPA